MHVKESSQWSLQSYALFCDPAHCLQVSSTVITVNYQSDQVDRPARAAARHCSGPTHIPSVILQSNLGLARRQKLTSYDRWWASRLPWPCSCRNSACCSWLAERISQRIRSSCSLGVRLPPSRSPIEGVCCNTACVLLCRIQGHEGRFVKA